MNLTLLIQFVSAISIFGVCFVGGIVPVRLTRWKPETLSYANCLSAGILLGAALVHLLFDAENVTYDYPFAHLCAGVGFFIAFLLEKILFAHKHDHGGHDDSHKDEEGHHHKKPKGKEIPLHKLHKKKKKSKEKENEIIEKQALTEEDITLLEPISETTSESSLPILSLKEEEEETKHEEVEVAHSHSTKPHSKWRETFRTHSAGFILFSVLALESFISGSALGIATNSLGVVVLLIAILTHIWAEAFALSSSFLKTKMENKLIYIWMAVFSGITPIGIFVGMGLKSVLQGKVATLISSLLISFAAGTFLYIAILEIIAEEFETPKNKWKKLNLLLLGFAFMAGLAVFI